MDKSLDFLASKGIDCIKIEGPRYKMGKTAFYPINMLDEENFMDDIEECGGNILTDDFMEIEVDYMSGEEIMKHNSNLKLEDNKAYNVVKIGYATNECLYHFTLNVVR